MYKHQKTNVAIFELNQSYFSNSYDNQKCKTEVKKGVIIVFTRTNEAIAQVIDRCQLKCIQEGLCCPRSYLREHMGYIKTTLFH